MSPRKRKDDPGSYLQTLDRFINIEQGGKGRRSEGEVEIPHPDYPESETKRVNKERIFDAEDIGSQEAKSFIDSLTSDMSERGSVGILFHNDMDGLNSAIMIHDMVEILMGDRVEIHTSSMEYKDLDEIHLSEDMTYIFCDMDIKKLGENIFRIDHHDEKRNRKMVDSHTFLLSPPDKDYEYPSTATALCSYLKYLVEGGDLSFFQYLDRGPWHEDDFSRLLILLASVCDNLWHLNLIVDNPLKSWISDKEEERYLILISISASMILGDPDRKSIVLQYFEGEGPDAEEYLTPLCSMLPEAKNVLNFSIQLSNGAEKFFNEIFFTLTDSLEKTLRSLNRNRETLRSYEESMPIDMKGNREKMMELLKTRGDLNDNHWRRIRFYGKEMVNLEAKIKVEEKKILKLRAAKKMISTSKGPRLCLMLPKQSSKQVKGILASLLYFMGWKNVVIEDRGKSSMWGARGFTKPEVQEHFSTLSLSDEQLKDYLQMEKVFKDLPEVFKRGVNISRHTKFFKTYSGGMGGRGLIFGGILTGEVPWVFSLLEESGDLEEKIRELIEHKELGSALKGFTEGKSVVPTAQAVRAKFRATGWLVAQLIADKEEPQVDRGNFRITLLNLVGYRNRFGVNLKYIPKREPPMEHQQFDGVIDR